MDATRQAAATTDRVIPQRVTSLWGSFRWSGQHFAARSSALSLHHSYWILPLPAGAPLTPSSAGAPIRGEPSNGPSQKLLPSVLA